MVVSERCREHGRIGANQPMSNVAYSAIHEVTLAQFAVFGGRLWKSSGKL